MTRLGCIRAVLLLSPALPAACVVILGGFELDQPLPGHIFCVSSLTNVCAIWWLLMGILKIRVGMGVPATLSPIILLGPPAVAVPILVVVFRSLFPAWLIAIWHFTGMYLAFLAASFVAYCIYIWIDIDSRGEVSPHDSGDD